MLLPLVLVAMRRGVIEREKRHLERVLGDEYLRTKRASGARYDLPCIV